MAAERPSNRRPPSGVADNIQGLSWRLQLLEDELSAAETRIKELEDQVRIRERNQLIAGLTFLGGVIITLGTVIWNYRGVIFNGE